MAEINITIDGYIGTYGYSKQWLREMLKGHENDYINLTLSSLGGSADHALAMHEILKRHGKVRATLSGFNASASTIIAMGAATRKISKYGFFLVHKVMNWIDEFGYMNEDDIEILIERLEKEKNESAKMTLALAQIYSSETGKSIQDLLNLMKQDTWLSAEEAKEWGFVDEIYIPSPDEKTAMYNAAKVAMIQVSGLPVPPYRRNEYKSSTQKTEALFDSETFLSRIINQLKETFISTRNPMQKQFISINSAIGVEKMECSEEGVYLNEEQLQIIDGLIAQVPALTQECNNKEQTLTSVIAERDRSREEHNTLNETLIKASSERDQANQELSNLLSLINAIDESVSSSTDVATKVAAIRSLIARKPGVAPAGQNATTDPILNKTQDGVDWVTLNSLPHMQEED